MDKKMKEKERKKQREEAMKNWGKKKDFIVIAGMPDDSL